MCNGDTLCKHGKKLSEDCDECDKELGRRH